MKEFDLCGKEFDDFASHFSNNGSDKNTTIDRLSYWNVPILPKKGDTIINQPKQGPCGLFASLQAEFIYYLMESEGKCEFNIGIFNSILRIMERISDKFEICTYIDIPSKTAHFICPESKDDALASLISLQYNELSNACLLLAVSFAYICRIHDWYQSMPAPFIYSDQNTSMLFVFVMVSGQIDGQSPKQSYISVNIKIRNKNETYFAKDSPVVIFYNGIHFFAGMKQDDSYLIFDTLGNGKVQRIKGQ